MVFSQKGMSFISHGRIGRGSYGIVSKVTDEKSRETHALKITTKSKSGGHSCIFESIIMSSINHPNLCHAINTSVNENSNFILMPLASCDLSKIQIPPEECPSVCFQIAQGLLYLHTFRILHGDIKPSNCLVYYDNKSGQKNIKLSDFSFSLPLAEGQQKNYQICTSIYRAPEVASGETWNLSMDIWSLACTFYEIYTGRELFKPTKEKEGRCKYIKRLSKWYSSKNRFHKIRDPLLKDLLLKMTKWTPSHRLTVQQVISHPYFSDFKLTEAKISLCGNTRKLDENEISYIKQKCHDFPQIRKTAEYITTCMNEKNVLLLNAAIHIASKIHNPENVIKLDCDMNEVYKKEIDICNKLHYRIYNFTV